MILRIQNNQETVEENILLLNTLGVTETLKFLEQFDNGGSGDYTAEKYEHEEPEPSDEEIKKMFGF